MIATGLASGCHILTQQECGGHLLQRLLSVSSCSRTKLGEMRAEQTPRLSPAAPKGQLHTGASRARSSGGKGGGLAARVGEGISSPSPPPLGSWLPSEDLCAIESCFRYFLSVSLWENHCPP